MQAASTGPRVNQAGDDVDHNIQTTPSQDDDRSPRMIGSRGKKKKKKVSDWHHTHGVAHQVQSSHIMDGAQSVQNNQIRGKQSLAVPQAMSIIDF